MGRRAKAAYLTVNIPMSSPDTIMGVTSMLLFAAIGLDKGYSDAHSRACYILHTVCRVLNVMPKLRQLDKNAYEAALTLGATLHQALRRRSSCPRLCRGNVTGRYFNMAFTMSIDDFVVSLL